MKIRNKKTGEVIDLSADAPKEAVASNDDFKSKSAETDKRIAERGTIQDSAKKVINDKSGVKKVVGALEVASAPFNAIESGIANPSLQLQKGNANPMDLIKESILGFSLQKQGQYGDIMKNAGYNPILADSAGLVLSLSPAKVFSAAAKTFGGISKMSDKALEKTGKNLLFAVSDAKNAVGTKVTQEFAKGADNVPVDGLQFLNDVANLPAPLMKKMEVAFGNLEDFAKGLNVGKVREFKRFLGKLKPNAYEKSDKGLQDTLDDIDINKAYSNVKGTLHKTLSDAKSGIDKKTVNYLIELDEAYHDVISAGRYIKKTIMDPTLVKPTRVGELADKVNLTRNSTARTALTTIKKSSRKAMDNVNQAMRRIENFNRWEKEKQMIGRGINAAVYGGAAGIGAKILNRAQDSGN